MKFIDLTGQQFGKWHVLSISQKKTTSGDYYFNCKCNCGREKIVWNEIPVKAFLSLPG